MIGRVVLGTLVYAGIGPLIGGMTMIVGMAILFDWVDPLRGLAGLVDLAFPWQPLVIASYAFGLLPALVTALIAGLSPLWARSRRERLLVAALAGGLSANLALIWVFGRLEAWASVQFHILLSLAGGLAGLSCCLLVERLLGTPTARPVKQGEA